VLDPPWSLRIRDEAPLTVMAVVRGTAWVVCDDESPVELQRRRRRRHPRTRALHSRRFADHPAAGVIHPGQVCTTPDGVNVADSMSQGVRTWGNNPDGGTVLLTGTYEGAARSAAGWSTRCHNWSCCATASGTAR